MLGTRSYCAQRKALIAFRQVLGSFGVGMEVAIVGDCCTVLQRDWNQHVEPGMMCGESREIVCAMEGM